MAAPSSSCIGWATYIQNPYLAHIRFPLTDLPLFRPQPDDERQFVDNGAEREKECMLRKQLDRAIYPTGGEGLYGIAGYNARMHQHTGVAVTVDCAGGATIAGIGDLVQVED